MAPLKFWRRDSDKSHPANFPDYHQSIFAPNSLNDYDPRTNLYESARDDLPDSSRVLQATQLVTDTHVLPDSLYDSTDFEFYNEQKAQNPSTHDYSNEYLQCSEQNPQKWYEIGVTFHNEHAAIILQNLTGTQFDISGLDFLYTGTPEAKSKRFVGGDFRKLDLVYERKAGTRQYDLELRFKELEPRPEYVFDRYQSFCRLRTTDRMIKYIALVSFPQYYRQVESDCATFAHKFIVNILARLRAGDSITKEQFKSIIRTLVKRNKVTTGTAGETEVLSRRHEAMGESVGGTMEFSEVMTEIYGVEKAQSQK
ncbi:hypothetical protein IQ06DRAFT_289473 [Phaeosphaeriaceae sp. SRC1lsM3a]|nr:hypothetical protein IQ06DRAFT_289473 [Stagonospora sp. SRC1lsM3a]